MSKLAENIVANQVTEEQIRQGWTRNSRGGWQPPDDQIDCSDFPATTYFSGYWHMTLEDVLRERRKRLHTRLDVKPE
jgi:hypothetical protein